MKEVWSMLEIQSLNDLDRLTEMPSIVVADHLANSEVIALAQKLDISHVVQKSSLNFAKEIDFSRRLLANPQNYFNFPLTMIFSNKNPCMAIENQIASANIFLGSPTQKDEALLIIEELAIQIVKSKSTIDDLKLIGDELITNAIYNAPYISKTGENLNIERNSEKVEIDPMKQPRLFFAHDAEMVAIGVQDFYGSLDVNRILGRIAGCYSNGIGNQILYGPGGAGIGSFMMYEASTSFIVGVNKGISTCICCNLPVQLSTRSRSVLPKNIHIVKT